VVFERPVQIIFCADPFNARKPDPAYDAEATAALDLGFDYHLVSYERLVDERDPAGAVRRVPEQPAPALAVYRGWMLRPEQYGQLFEALAARRLTLVNDPAAYALCHELPRWYPLLEPWTPVSTWLATHAPPSADELDTLLRPLGGGPIIVKDFVKSRKHEWAVACYIPDSNDRPTVERVVHRFLELQGPDLSGGLVFRAYEPFEPLATHSRTGMPLTLEYRVFCLDGEPIVVAEYWEEGEYAGAAPPIEDLRPMIERIESRLFTVDVARRQDGTWRVVELGDGQVAGLPDRTDPVAFYRTLLDRLTRSASGA
jgi:hypothetical protein